MPSDSLNQVTPKWMLWTGWFITVLVVGMLTMSSVMKFVQPVGMEEEFTGKLGWEMSLAISLGIVELVCTLIFAIPQTSILGAILLTGYFGGAVATHVRVHDPFFGPVIGGVLVWSALFLRDARLRTLIPLKRSV